MAAPTPPQSSPAFQDAAQYMTKDPKATRTSNTVKLELYALFKYVTVGPTPNTSRPSIFDMTGRAKWDAWSQLSKGSAIKDLEGAEKRYLEIAREYGWKNSDGAPSEEGAANKTPLKLGKVGGATLGGPGGMGPAVSAVHRPSAELKVDDATLQGVVLGGNAAEVVAFLDKDPNVQIDDIDAYGFTALHLAADRGFFESVKVLVSRGANIGVKDPDGLTAISLAREADYEEIVQYLEKQLVNAGEDGQGA